MNCGNDSQASMECWFGLTVKQAFNYLSRFKGIDFIDKHYDYAHTQSFESMIDDIATLCVKDDRCYANCRKHADPMTETPNEAYHRRLLW